MVEQWLISGRLAGNLFCTIEALHFEAMIGAMYSQTFLSNHVGIGSRGLFGWRLPDHGGYLFNRHWLKDVKRCVGIPADDCWVTELSSRLHEHCCIQFFPGSDEQSRLVNARLLSVQVVLINTLGATTWFYCFLYWS